MGRIKCEIRELTSEEIKEGDSLLIVTEKGQGKLETVKVKSIDKDSFFCTNENGQILSISFYKPYEGLIIDLENKEELTLYFISDIFYTLEWIFICLKPLRL